MEFFGSYNNRPVVTSILENEYLKVEVMNLGACLLKLIDKKTNKDIVLGFNNINDYLNNHGLYMGMSVGRVAGRIKNGRFILNDKEYQLPQNDRGNCHHGGNNDFSLKVYDVSENGNQIVYTTTSLDNEEGFPGQLDIKIIYHLQDNRLIWEYKVYAHEDSIVDITNHSYFNLIGNQRTVLGQKLCIPCDYVAMIDETGLNKAEIIRVQGTSFDFRIPKKIGEAFNNMHENMILAKGIDHCYVFEKQKEGLRAKLESSKLALTIYSDLPDMQVYSGNYLKTEVGKEGAYGENDGICFECQHYPNAINYTGPQKPIIRKGESISHYICYQVENKDE